MNAILPRFLRWAFSGYNQRAIKPTQFDGELKLSGIKKSAAIYRDKWHVPHIYTENNADMFFCQGFVHAQDRFWQMEINRRIGQGRLAETFGKDALNTDRLIRTLGFNRLAQQDFQLLSEKHLNFLKMYATGVNAWLEQKKLPIEFLLTGIKPKPWTVLDTLAWGRVMTWTLSHGWSGALTRRAIIDKVGEDMAEELGIFYPDGNPTEIPHGIDMNHLKADEMVDASQGPFLAKDMEGGGRGSNAWAISPDKTETGRPMLCNDTHLNLSMPGIWYMNHLQSDEDFHCTGSTIPGLPGVLLGHNEKIAWGITLAYTDVEDIFVEKLDVTNPDKYEYKGKTHDFDIIEETIRVKGEDDHIEKIKTTVHGPLIGSVTEYSNQSIAICSKSLTPNTIISGFFDISQADNWKEFSKGVEKVQAPQLNIVYSDVEGNIGMYVSGRVPVRKKGAGDVPVPGWTGEYDWTGEISHAEMPHVLNPDCGYIISCNHKITDDDYPHYLGNSFMNGYRAARIEEKFKEVKLIDYKLVQDLHMDVISIPGKRVRDGLIKGLRTAKPKAQKLIDLFTEWDCSLDENSIGGTVYQVFLYTLVKNIVEPHLGQNLTEKYMGVGEHPLLLPVNELLGHSTEAVFRIFQNSDSKWVPSGKAALSVIEKSLVESCLWLEENMGYESSNWQWGNLHKAEFQHSMAIKKPFDRVFNAGPFPIGGDTDTVHQSAYNPSTPYHSTAWSPSNRFIMDVGNWNACVAISPPGQSGVLGSSHYDDMVPLWRTGKYIPMPWSRDKVEEAAESKLVLKP